MAYQTLKRMSFQDMTQWKTLLETRFNSVDTIHVGITVHDFPAFVVSSPEIFKGIIDIMRLDKEVTRIYNDLPRIATEQFSRRCLVNEIVITNSIEGVNSTRKEISDVLNTLSVQKGLRRFRGLVQKYHMLQTTEELQLNTCQDIRAVYDELVLEEVRQENIEEIPDGEIFRKGPVSVYGGAVGKELHRGLFPEEKIHQAMEQALSFLNNSTSDIFIRIAVFHYLIGYIHPFYNGNGRLSRFISSYLLAQQLNPLVAYRLSYTIKENLSQYYDGFKECNDPRNAGDLTPFVIMFIQIIAQSMEQLKNALAGRQSELQKYRIIMEKLTISEKLKQSLYFLVQASLFSENGIPTSVYVAATRVSRTTAINRLHELGKKIPGIVVVIAEGKEKHYQANLNVLRSIQMPLPPT